MALGVAFTAMCTLLLVGSLNEGDAAAAFAIGLPGTVLGSLGTLLYAALPRRRVVLKDGLVRLGKTPCPDARISTLGTTGEGFSTTDAFQLIPGPGLAPLWFTKWSFPALRTMHARLSETLPVDPLPPERPNPFLRKFHARQAEREAEDKKKRPRP